MREGEKKLDEAAEKAHIFFLDDEKQHTSGACGRIPFPFDHFFFCFLPPAAAAAAGAYSKSVPTSSSGR